MNKKDELEKFVLDDVYEVIEIGFLDHKIKTVIDEYQNIWISVESICDHLKIDSEKEIESLIDSDLDVWILKVFDSTLGKYNLFMINIDSIKLWLNTIHFNHIKFESRGILIKYRSKIIDVIKTAINDKKIVTDKIIEEKETSIIEDHFKGEELVGRVVFETEGEESKDEEFQYGGAKRPVIDVEEEVEEGTVKCDILEEEKDEEMKEEKMSKDAMNDIVKMFEYEGEPLTALTYKGQPAVIAKEFGKFLGYSKDGSKLVSLINDEWKKFFKEGKHFVVLRGKDLKDFKEMLGVNPSHGFTRVVNLTLLFKAGMYKTAFHSGKERAEPLIDFVVDEVFPQLEMDGRYDPNRNVDSIEVIGGEFRIPDDLSESLRLAAYLNDKRLEAEKERSLAIDRAEKAENTIDEIAPLADWAYSLYSCSGDGKTIGKFAKSVKIGGVSYGKKKMFALLRELNILIDSGEEYNWPYQRYIDNNWLAIKSEKKIYKNGRKRLIEKVVIFKKGEMGIIGKVLNSQKYEGKSVKYNGIEMGGQMLLKNISTSKKIKKI